MDNDTLYIIPSEENKSVKIVFEEFPCPLLLQLGATFRCKCAKSKTEDFNWTLYCSADKCEHKIGIIKFE